MEGKRGKLTKKIKEVLYPEREILVPLIPGLVIGYALEIPTSISFSSSGSLEEFLSTNYIIEFLHTLNYLQVVQWLLFWYLISAFVLFACKRWKE